MKNRTFKGVLAAAMALAVVMSLGAMTALADDAAVISEATVISETTTYEDGLTITEDDLISAPEGYTVTMTVDGVQTNIEAGTYEGVVVLTVTDSYTISGPNMGELVDLELRAAQFYQDGVLVPSLSVQAAVVDNTITSVGDDFNGIVVMADSEDSDTVELSDYTIDFTGYGTNDMGGFGAALMVSDYGKLTVNNFKIVTDGSTRTAAFVSGHGTLTVNDTTIYTLSTELPDFVTDELNNMEVPWMLGLTGNCRATNVVGDGNANYNDSIVIATNWGALSTDTEAVNATEGTVNLTVTNTYAAVLTSGYGAYADGSAEDYFYGVAFDVGDVGAIITGSGYVTFENSTINAGTYAVMSHSGSTGAINLIDSDVHVQETGILIKDSANAVTITNTSIAFDGTYEMDEELAASYGVDLDEVNELFDVDDFEHIDYIDESATTLVKLQHNFDAGSGSESSGADATVQINDSTLVGDIINSAATEEEISTTMMGSTTTVTRPARTLSVTMDNSSVTGAITLAEDTEISVCDLVTMSGSECELQYVSAMEFKMNSNGEKGLELTLTNGSSWIVDETSYITSLVIDETSTVEAADGYTVVMTVDGVETPIEAGEYSGEIVLTVTAAEESAEEALDDTEVPSSDDADVSSADTAVSSTDTSAAEVGDSSMLGLWAVAAVLAAAGIVLVVRRRING